MRKHFYSTLLLFIPVLIYAQGLPGRRTMSEGKLKLNREVPTVNPNSSARIQVFGREMPDLRKRVVRDIEQGAVSYIENPGFSRDSRRARMSARQMSFEFLNSVKEDIKVDQPEKEFLILDEGLDNGIKRVKLQQTFKNIPVYGAELSLSSNKQGVFEVLFGKVFPTPKVSIQPNLNKEQAINKAFSDLENHAIVRKTELLNNILSFEPDKGELMIYNYKGENKLIYHLDIRPNVMERWVYFVDAHSGEVLDKYNYTCTLDGLVNASSKDLNGVEQAFNAIQLGSDYVMIDINKKMYKQSQSKLPNSPVGAIMTIDARNARVDNEDADLYHVVTNNPRSWDPIAVSAHYNASKSYDYYEKIHGRTSLNGSGGNIISVINITDERGRGFENAFWNGVFMGYGNGGDMFKPLAGALDVGGHEMTHGVIENTAKLEYRNQSGALNESFADIFGTMIERENWVLGESIVNTKHFPSGALRSLANPNQGGKNDPGYQPMHMSQYAVLRDTPEQDNGGVHINSGIPNHAYYLFATDSGNGMTIEKAEKVYYHALTRYIGRTSKFLDLRLAVIQSAKDLFGEGKEVAAARQAFDKVGITDSSGSGGNTQPSDPSKETEIQTNPGQAKMIAFNPTPSNQSLYLADFNFNGSMNFKKITDKYGCLSKPSVTDDGNFMVFIGNDQKIHVVNLQNFEHQIFQDGLGVKWFNVAVSKDGNRLAAIADASKNNNYIFVIDLVKGEYVKMPLYNPTYSSGVTSGEVQYAEALEWDYSGEYVVYDALNTISGWFSGGKNYYDVGILRAWDPIKNAFGDGTIEKIFASLPDGVSIGNPTFAKTNSAILAFDYVEEDLFSDFSFGIITVDLNKSSDDGLQLFENTTIGFPDFSKTDEHLVFNYKDNNRDVIVGVRLQKDKISLVPNSAVILANDAAYGVLFANGERALPTVQEQTISIGPIADQNPGGRFDINASVDSGLPLNYTVSNGDATISGRTVQLGNNPGKIVVQVAQLGTNQYKPVAVETSFCIIPPAPQLADNGDHVTATGSGPFQFYVNGNAVGPLTSDNNFKKQFDGEYSVKTMTQDGCSSIFSNKVGIQTILGNEIISKNIIVSPNPVADFLVIQIPEGEKLNKISIIDNSGRIFMTTESMKTDVRKLSSGLYLLNVSTDGGEYSAKIIKL